MKYAIGCIVVIVAILLLAALDGLIGGNVHAGEPVRGQATHYPQTAGFEGQATVALPSGLGGRSNGSIYAYVTVCGDRCATLPAVDWCQCFEGEADERIVDLSEAAWPLVTDKPLREGKIIVTVEVEFVGNRSGVPDTAMPAP